MDAAKAIQQQMEEEDAIEEYAFGPQRIAAKKRESDASLRHQSLDRRTSNEVSHFWIFHFWYLISKNYANFCDSQ